MVFDAFVKISGLEELLLGEALVFVFCFELTWVHNCGSAVHTPLSQRLVAVLLDHAAIRGVRRLHARVDS